MNDRLYIPISLSDLDWVNIISNKSKLNDIQNIKIHESSSSNFNFSEIIAWRIKKLTTGIDVNIYSHREKDLDSFSLTNQCNNNKFMI